MLSRFRPWRRTAQILTALAVAAIPIANAKGFAVISGNFFSFNLAGLPFADPLAAAQALLGGQSTARTMLLGAGIVLAVALVLGRVFCSWLCPYGLFSEWVFTLRGKPQEAISGQNPVRIRLSVAAVGILAVATVIPVPILNQLSMPGWYSLALQHSAFYGAILYSALFFPLMLALEAVKGERLWCRYLCPQSALLSLFAAAPAGLRVQFTPKLCSCAKNDRACLAACSLRLNPRKPEPLQRFECTNCGDCVDACSERGKALSLITYGIFRTFKKMT